MSSTLGAMAWRTFVDPSACKIPACRARFRTATQYPKTGLVNKFIQAATQGITIGYFVSFYNLLFPSQFGRRWTNGRFQTKEGWKQNGQNLQQQIKRSQFSNLETGFAISQSGGLSCTWFSSLARVLQKNGRYSYVVLSTVDPPSFQFV